VARVAQLANASITNRPHQPGRDIPVATRFEDLGSKGVVVAAKERRGREETVRKLLKNITTSASAKTCKRSLVHWQQEKRKKRGEAIAISSNQTPTQFEGRGNTQTGCSTADLLQNCGGPVTYLCDKRTSNARKLRTRPLIYLDS
jgi:hypothetical protein